MTRKNFTIIISIVAVGIISGMFLFMSCVSPTEPEVEVEVIALKLSDYPEIFSEDVTIVVGEKASAMEKESAQTIAESLKNSTGIKPQVITEVEITDVDLPNYNLILVGTPESNKLLNIVYDTTDATRVRKEYVGENKGILEIFSNPWNKKKALLLVAGDDEWGAKAGSELLEYARDLDISRVTVEWKKAKAIFSRTIPKDKYIFLEILQEEIILGQKTWPQGSFHGEGSYNFDNKKGNLKIKLPHFTPSQYERLKRKFAINDDLALIVGNNVVVKGVNDWKEGVEPIYVIPTSWEAAFGLKFEIVYSGSNGTVHITYKDRRIVLGPKKEHSMEFGEKWFGQNVVHKVTIRNYGLQDKDKIAVEYRYKGGVPLPAP